MQAKDQTRLIKRLGPDLDNIRQAIRWAIDTGQADRAYVLIDGFHHLFIAHAGENDMLGWMLSIGEIPRLDNRLRAKVLLFASRVYGRTGRFDEAQEMLEHILAMGDSLDDPQLEFDMLGGLASVASSRKQFSKARAYFEKGMALAVSRDLFPPEQLQIVMADWDMWIAFHEGDYPRAIAASKIAYVHSSQNGNKMETSAEARMMGYFYLYSGDAVQAALCFRESLLDNHALGDRLAVSACLYAFAATSEKVGDMPRAACLFAAAIRARSFTGLPTMPWDTECYESSLAAVKGQLDQPALAAMWARGEAMTLEQAMAYALDEHDRT